MTIEEIKRSNKEMLTPNDICGIIGCAAYNITLQARQDIERGTKSFPFPIIVIGTRTKIPRRPFLQSLGIEV